MSDIGILVPLAGIGVGAFAIWTRHQRSMAQTTAEHTAEKAAQYATHNRELEERVRVLERIVTDKGYDVSAQIEALRDANRVDGDPGAGRKPADSPADKPAGRPGDGGASS